MQVVDLLRLLPPCFVNHLHVCLDENVHIWWRVHVCVCVGVCVLFEQVLWLWVLGQVSLTPSALAVRWLHLDGTVHLNRQGQREAWSASMNTPSQT